VFDSIDDHQASKSTTADAQAFFDNLSNSDNSSLSDVDSDEFEDVPVAKKRKVTKDEEDNDTADNEDDDEMDWEDAIGSEHAQTSSSKPGAADGEIGDLSISLQEDGGVVAARAIDKSDVKKGPSKRERQIRNGTHSIHVQALMWHNTIRNSWLNDKEVQKVLVDGLSPGIRAEVDRWKHDMGMKVEKKHDKKAAKSKSRPRDLRRTSAKVATREVEGIGTLLRIGLTKVL